MNDLNRNAIEFSHKQVLTLNQYIWDGKAERDELRAKLEELQKG